ncbi:hypothetical protein [Streptomyces thermoalcalitolerans]|uniref:Uncharacterized protein n=1 Tax=Streptomyces thermoalcalitolerans TaxID=65605 RepID=A0ABN1NRS5_9ACTN
MKITEDVAGHPAEGQMFLSRAVAALAPRIVADIAAEQRASGDA